MQTRRDSFTSSLDINSVSVDVQSVQKSGREIARARWITIEPILWLGAMSNAGLVATRIQYLRERIAVDRYNQSTDANVTSSLCFASVGNDSAVEDAIQSELSLYALILNALSTFPAIFTTILVGSLSDRAGRRIGLVVPMIGVIIQSAIYVALFYAHLPLWWAFIADALQGIAGGSGLILGTAAAYIADITDEEHRTWRIVIAESSFIFGYGVIQPINGLLIEHFGMGVAFAVSLGVVIPGLIYAAVPWTTPETVDEQVDETFTEYMKDIFREIYRLAAVNVNGRRWKLVALVASELFFNTVINGSTIVVTYGLGPPFCWGPDVVGYYNAASNILSVLGVLAAVKLLGYCLTDMWMLHCGMISLLAGYLVNAIAPSTFLIFIGVLPGGIGGLVSPVMKGILSKTVDDQEQGAMFALAGCVDNVSQFVGPILANAIYASTVSFYSPLVFYVLASLLVFPTIFISIVQISGIKTRNGYDPIPDYESS